jgi:hypothetical protein
MIPDHYVWFAWASAFVLAWAALYVAAPAHRRQMRWAAFFTAPFGLAEPLFVPDYWNPPSLFDLAQRTGFDIESVLFAFGVGGVAAVVYSALTGHHARPLAPVVRHARVHRRHRFALAAPFLAFPLLYPLPWNPIYPGILAMLIGAGATIACRPDLKTKTLIGGLLFLAYYSVFLGGLQLTAPGYVERVWNLSALSGVLVFGAPVEELLWALAFGTYWSGVYEHFTWYAADGGR